MSLLESEEGTELRRIVHRFLADRCPVSATRALMDDATGTDAEVWATITGQLGLAGLGVPEEYGGGGAGPRELAIVVEEMGAVLLGGPYFATVALAGQALAAADDTASKARWLPGIADGSVTAALAIGEDGDAWAAESPRTIATRQGPGWRLSGAKTYVVDGATADLVLVVARTADGVGLFAVRRGAGGLDTEPLPTLDLTRRLARVELSSVPADRVEGVTPVVLDRVRDLALVALAAEQVGGAQRCLDLAVDYARMRTAFGRPIGSFQAVKHRCADVLLLVETARSALLHAAGAAADDPTGPEPAIAAAVAASACSTAYTSAARACVQVHGGIGFTWEHDAHLYLKRATADGLLLGTPAQHRTRLAALLGLSVVSPAGGGQC